MKVLLINGSPNMEGSTYTALTEVQKTLEQEGIECELIQSGNGPVRDCIGCGGCAGKGACVFEDDIVNEIIEKAAQADGFVFGTPVYYAHPSGRVLSIMDRVFYAGGAFLKQKPAATVASARRAGTIASLDALNKHLTINQMPVISSTYWNEVHGNKAQETVQDLEGMETMRNLARNMAWILKCIDYGKTNGIMAPETSKTVSTNFIR